MSRKNQELLTSGNRYSYRNPFQVILRVQALEVDCLGSKAISAIYELCDWQQVTKQSLFYYRQVLVDNVLKSATPPDWSDHVTST